MDLQKEKILITGGSKGLGRAVVQALMAVGASVTVIARNKTLLDEMVGDNVSIIAGDVTNQSFINKVMQDLKPTLLILNAGATPVMAPIDEQDWEQFSAVWNTDVQAGLHAIQAALKTPMPEGSRVIIVSSGAGWGGSALSGGYAGAKRTLWFMAKYANELASQRSLDIQFQVVVPMQIIAETDLGKQAAGAYAQRKNMTIEDYLAAGNSKLLSAAVYANYFVSLLADRSYRDGMTYSIKHDGIAKID